MFDNIWVNENIKVEKRNKQHISIRMAPSKLLKRLTFLRGVFICKDREASSISLNFICLMCSRSAAALDTVGFGSVSDQIL